MGTIIAVLVIYFLFAKSLGAKAKLKGYESWAFILLIYVVFFGVMVLSAYSLSLVLNVDNDTIGRSVGIGSIIIGIAIAYYLPNLIILKLPNKGENNNN